MKKQLERYMQIAQDTKKSFSYDKSDGTWAWYDRDEEDNIDAYHVGFSTFWEALLDAIEPYIEDIE